MRGHEPLIAMRKAGKCPDVATIELGRDTDSLHARWQHLGMSPCIEIGPNERLSGLDLRCIVGMNVIVQGDDEARTIRAAELVLAAKAKACYVTVHEPKTQRIISAFYYTEQAAPWQEF